MSRPIRVLILTQYFPPETGAPQTRLFELGQWLVQQGFQIDVLTALPNYPQGRVYDGYRGKLYSVEQDAGMRVVHAPIFPSRSPRLISRMLSYFSFVFSSIVFGLFLARRPNVVICESPPLFLGLSALVLKTWFRCKLIFNVSDLFPESAVRMGMHDRKSFVWLAKRLEELCYRGSDAQTGQSPGIVRGIRASHRRGRIELIPNGCDCELFHPKHRNAELFERFANDDNVVVGYAGLIGLAQGVRVLLEVAERFLDDERVVFVIAGEGAEREQLEEDLAARHLPNVVFTGWLPKCDMPETVASFDISFIPLRYFIPGALPSKVYESMASQVPIVLAAEGDAKELIERADAGIVAKYDADDISTAIRRLADDPHERLRLGENGRRYVLEHHQRHTIAHKLGNLIELLADDNPGKLSRAA
jgi:glycosyltransferase involved in cell wall biosynthesis